MKESVKRAQEKYQQKCRLYNIRVNTETEKDIVDWMQKGPVGSRIKKLIREDIKINKKAKGRKIKLRNGAVIIEKRSDDKWHTYDYYINDRFIFGTFDPFPDEAIQNLYDIGYFDI